MNERSRALAAASAAPLRRAIGPVREDTGSFRQFILKVASRCNLACDYCYVYQGHNQEWRTRPRVMSRATITAIGRRIAEHARAHQLGTVQVVFHGGEPLLAGPDAIDWAVTELGAALPPGTRLQAGIQSNGLLLTDDFLRVLGKHEMFLGISMDGDRAANDRHRRHRDGRGSYAGVDRALRLLSASQPTLLAGLLCTIDLANDPIATYETLARFAPPVIDFLLPLANWSHPPPGGQGGPRATAPLSGTPYADWLIPVFDHWYESRDAISIRLFDEIINLLLGGRPSTEIIGGGGADFSVIETDGTIDSSDTLTFAHEGAASTGLSVFRDSFDDVLAHPAVAGQRRGARELCAACLSCPVASVCGGGQYAHRYRAGSGFDNPSVYCADLYRVIGHIGRRVLADLRATRGRKP